ncbi:MAG: spore coat associated protein CotJA [Ruminococcus sp.]|nr:spore coat associated protein CotJA [Ruminococcus sp.]
MNLSLFDNAEGLIMHEREKQLNAVSDNFDSSRFPKKTPLGIAYVPFQQWGDVYSDDEGFPKGTIFPDLDFPFEKGDK